MVAPIAHVGHGTYEPLQLLPPTAAIIGYALRSRTLAAEGRPVPRGKQLFFAAGMLLVFVALVSPAAHIGEELVLAHMAQHLLMADVGALLIVLGLTGPLLAPLLRARGLGWLRHLAQPVPAFGLWAVDLVFWHVVGPHEAAVRHDGIHALQHMLFVGLGINMWLALLGPLPKPAWFGNLGRLGYRAGERAHDISPQTDQVVAGGIMMVEGSILTICLFGWLFLRSAREGEERQELIELAAAGGFALDERRAARAVAAGRGAELRRRIEEGHPMG
jgi:putative membrane protein